MRRWLRRLYMIGLATLPALMAWLFHRWGLSLRSVQIPIRVPLGAIVVPWWIGWEMAPLAGLLEGGVDASSSWREEIGTWLLYTLMGASIGLVFAAWIWLTLSSTHLLVAWLPAGETALGEPCAGIVGLIWFVLGLWGLLALMERDIPSAFRRGLRRRLLGGRPSARYILRLLEAAPLPTYLREPFANAIRRRGMSEQIAEDIWLMLEELAAAGQLPPTRHLLQLQQALRAWLPEDENA